MSNKRFEAEAALAPLKTFQRRTVDYVFDRLYGGQDPVRQFLVADEVGLGKTMVARGVIARTIEKLWDTTDRIDILYICSNQAIAAQNLNRLNVLNRRELALPTRMTLIPLQLQGTENLDANKVNFISLTPGTTFNLRSTTGVAKERALIYRLLEDLVANKTSLRNLLQVGAGCESWVAEIDAISLDGIDQKITERFKNAIRSDPELRQELENVCALFPRRSPTYSEEKTTPRNALIGKLRAKLSHVCVHALSPDLIIMDEFQKFRELLNGDSDSAILARELFDYKDGDNYAARTLLLSATPYRMLTLSGDDPDDGEHCRDFLETLTFLYGRTNGPEIAKVLEHEMREFRQYLHALPGARPEAIAARRTVEQRLRKVMVRTERVASTADRDSMVSERPMPITIQSTDLRQAVAVSDVACALDAPQIIEYWKSAPYLLNFMRDYALKRLLRDNLDRPRQDLREALDRARSTMLDRDRLDAYEPLEPASGRMRGVMDEVFGDGLDQHLWIPPALAYYGPGRTGAPLTKALIFSSWSMVPDAISAIFSFEAERRMGVGASGQRYFSRVRPRPIQFRLDQARPASMRAMHLVYPSPTLARLADPLEIFGAHSETLSVEAMRKAVGARLRDSVHALAQRPGDGGDGRDWEWAAPAVIDAMEGAKSVAWVASPFDFAMLGNEEGFKEHVAELGSVATDRKFGPVPDSLLDLLVDVALGSPAICALRAMHRIAPDLKWDDHRLLKAASEVAWGFRTLFNQHDAVALLRKDDERYWHRVLTYGVEHNLQAVLDEYAHYLVDAEGLGAQPSAERVAGVSKAIAEALAVRPSQIDVDDPTVDGQRLVINKFQMRGRFAMRLADYKDEEGAAARLGSVRDSFNSPFRPFVLATTSVGQEGLDFHPYCYRVYHWNLPSNPVDLEQREGRVHRFKGHAIRLNLAARQSDVVRAQASILDDPWKAMFDAARVEAENDSELIPYWIYEGQVKVERRVPMLPFSREVRRLEWLKRSLTIYRLAFGQPRQEDLLEYLSGLLESEMAVEDLGDLQIHLDP